MIAMLTEAVFIMKCDHQIGQFFIRDSAAELSIQSIDGRLAQRITINLLDHFGERITRNELDRFFQIVQSILVMPDP